MLLFLLPIFFALAAGSLRDRLHHYEIIHSVDIHAVSRRSLDSVYPKLHQEVQLSLAGLKKGKKLKLHLSSDNGIFSEDFLVKAVHHDGSMSPIIIRENEFFKGTVEGEDNSSVLAYWEGGALHATIETPEKTIVVEPAWRHDDGMEDIREDSMLVYDVSDIKEEKNVPNEDGHSPSFCGAVHVERNISEKIEEQSASFTADRLKRQASNQNTCRLLLVADYKYFQGMGGDDLYRTATYLVSVIERVNTIYRNTVFSSNYRGYGFEIAEMRIHDSPTTVTAGESHYNMAENSWGTSNLLQAFSRSEGLSSFCLAHLFTSQSFSNNVLGLAYIAPASAGGLGGICTSSVQASGGLTTYNTGFTTSLNIKGAQLLRQQADLVTAHELGHNWGSEHDPGSGDCSPSSSFGGDGKYLMYPIAVTGYDVNNHRLSSCSKNYISKALTYRSSCFTAKKSSESPCGNGLLDEGEECDGGFLGSLGVDQCCNAKCKLTSGSTCSPLNSACCVNCLTAPIGWACYTSTDENCLKSSFCTGDSTDCPEPKYKDDGSPCLDNGLCKDGKCLSFCEARNLTSCICVEVGNSCKRCCKSADNRACSPYMPVSLLPNGRTCVQGYCEKGTCLKTKQSLIQRLFDLIKSIDIDFVLEAIRTNVVSFIVACTLIVWIPVSCILSYRDRKRKRQWADRMNIEIRRDRELVFDQDKRKVVRPKELRAPRVSRPPRFGNGASRA